MSPAPDPIPPKAQAPGTRAPGNGRNGDLGSRMAAGLAMAALALLVTWWGLLPFAGLVLLIGLLMSWEWGRVVRASQLMDTVGLAQATTGVLATVLTAAGYAAMALVAVAVGAIIAMLIRLGRGARLSGLGVLYVGLPTIALIWLRADPRYGFLAILFLFVTVWATDTGAYASGRLIGGPRLWPSVSPNKTWAGVVGGLLASALTGAGYALFLQHWGEAPVSLGGLTATGLLLGAVALAGDLAESALKRGFGVKDTSHLIPGHGGVLDRMDSTVPVAVAAALIALAVDVHAPGRALLFGL